MKNINPPVTKISLNSSVPTSELKVSQKVVYIINSNMQLPIVPNGGFVCCIQSFMNRLVNCPTTNGITTVMVNVETIFVTGTFDETPTIKNSNNGVINIPRKLPNAELKIAAASFPPIALVIITADETGGGIHPTMRIPFKSQEFMLVKSNRFTKIYINAGMIQNVKHWINTWTLTFNNAALRSSVRNETPPLKNIIETAMYLTVISGYKIPPFLPIHGASFESKITPTSPIMNQFFLIFSIIFSINYI